MWGWSRGVWDVERTLQTPQDVDRGLATVCRVREPLIGVREPLRGVRVSHARRRRPRPRPRAAVISAPGGVGTTQVTLRYGDSL